MNGISFVFYLIGLAVLIDWGLRHADIAVTILFLLNVGAIVTAFCVRLMRK